MKSVYESREGQALGPDEIDGMEEMLGDDTLPTDYDLAEGPIPCIGFWLGTHDRQSKRIPGFTEEQYQRGEQS
ncbi:MAG: hypothetical protein GYA56_00970 [Geobacteraceae bacterium]|nr:hypothetical protein [Geobacteraceae bacterium]